MQSNKTRAKLSMKRNRKVLECVPQSGGRVLLGSLEEPETLQTTTLEPLVVGCRGADSDNVFNYYNKAPIASPDYFLVSSRVANSINRRLETKNSSNALIGMLAAKGKKAVCLEQRFTTTVPPAHTPSDVLEGARKGEKDLRCVRLVL
ncbi:hypothetical protein EYF80_000091 [Liparis tanakae]|uniref:Uncharacterized protein n=1 Tax=Liparis tanakae TaxID=230148 RepID=A0A4Z2JIM8_9TELE|nr:hypothetical protein EYF80_000091 [Liparis tanakae]